MKIVKPKKKAQQTKQRETISPPSVYRDKIVKTINNISGRYSVYDVFSDWVAIMALSIVNSCDRVLPNAEQSKVWQVREKQYLSIIRKYSKDEVEGLTQCFANLVLSFENYNFHDMLGSIFMQLNCGNKHTGQFFTPYDVSRMMAEMTVPQDYTGDKPFSISEPAVGGGGMIIATAQVLFNRGHNPQRCMRIVAQDIDWTAVYMSYVQFSLLGLNAIVAQGNTLTEPYVSGYPDERVFYTPNKMGLLV